MKIEMKKMRVVFLLISILCMVNCKKKESDKTKAEQERKEVEKSWKSSFGVSQYRFIKTFWRSTGEPNRPKEFEKMAPFFSVPHFSKNNGNEPVLSKPMNEFEQKGVNLFQLGSTLYQSYQGQGDLAKVDEDSFPLFWTKISGEPPLFSSYDQGVEHLSFATLWLLVEQLAPSDQLPWRDIIFYEISKSQISPSWPDGAKLWFHFCQGFALMQSHYFYAADEELSSFLGDVEHIDLAGISAFFHISSQQLRSGLLASGYFVRALNRISLNRYNEARKDMEAALHEIASLGIENSLTDWAWAFVYVEQNRFSEAYPFLKKLSAHPSLTDRSKKQFYNLLQANKDFSKVTSSFFTKEQGLLLFSREILSRFQGVDEILSKLLGHEKASHLSESVAWLTQIQLALSSIEITDFAKGIQKNASAIQDQLINWKSHIKK